MKNKYKYHYYRPVRVRAEMRDACVIKEDGVREQWGRRTMHDLDPWNLEKCHGYQKSWKKLRRTKYREAGLKSGKNKYTLGVKDWFNMRKLEKYFKAYNIPYCINERGHRELVRYTRYTKNVFVGYKKYVCGNGKERLWPEYKEVVLNPPEEYRYWNRHIDGYDITWWSDKDIGVNYILKGV
jgi:hypothetical protein